MGWYRYRYKKKKWKPGFWVYVHLEAPNGCDCQLRLFVTPTSFKRYWEWRFGSGSAERQFVSDINFKNSCQCQWDGENSLNGAGSGSKQGVLGVNGENSSDIQ